ncbi:hypothetical protein LVO79_11650 [Roseivivax marinus]|uniref:hypothetical protein n=1 Tax=Roseivivax marinus TaxID=1379903 RepID=UPI001F0390CB|nr:hypothetical protein [Roseivivax marinus]UMA63687.1 hypothetical protein LVO79_11650 [Roseivivax marinus]
MKSMALAFVALAVLTVGAWFVLTSLEHTSATATADNRTVRLGEAGPEEPGNPMAE